jgi:hypothetical protein
MRGQRIDQRRFAGPWRAGNADHVSPAWEAVGAREDLFVAFGAVLDRADGAGDAP